MGQTRERKSSKDDSLDLEARARITFAATADDTEESGISPKDDEGLSNEGLHEYLDKAINEANKEKSDRLQIHKGDETQT